MWLFDFFKLSVWVCIRAYEDTSFSLVFGRFPWATIKDGARGLCYYGLYQHLDLGPTSVVPFKRSIGHKKAKEMPSCALPKGQVCTIALVSRSMWLSSGTLTHVRHLEVHTDAKFFFPFVLYAIIPSIFLPFPFSSSNLLDSRFYSYLCRYLLLVAMLPRAVFPSWVSQPPPPGRPPLPSKVQLTASTHTHTHSRQLSLSEM